MLESAMQKPRLTIGFAHYDDFRGLWPTIQSFRVYHREVMPQTEFVIVDNNPESEQAKLARDFVQNWGSRGNCGAQWIPFTAVKGTSAPRDHVFRVARGDVVLVCDPHILIEPGSLNRLLDYYEANPDSLDMLQGPLLYDDAETVGGTHFDQIWRAEMLGVWSTDQRGTDPQAEPFEIPAQGLGVFAMRRAAWVGFPAGLSGFGGEECNVHELVRQRGGRTLCAPWLRWLHRFGRDGGTPYPLLRWQKVRNYVIWAKTLGKPLADIHDHFVSSGLLSQADWQAIVEGADRPPSQGLGVLQPKKSSCGDGGREQPPFDATLEEVYKWACTVPRDLDKHLPKLRELASQCSHVTEFTKRRESTVAIAAATPEVVVSYQLEIDPLNDRVKKLALESDAVDRFEIAQRDSLAIDPIEATDMLFIDTEHNAIRLWAELEKHAGNVRRFVVLHDTKLHGEQGDKPGTPGLLPAVRRFVQERPQWSVLYHTDEQYGLTVLGCDPRDKPKLPSLVTMARNFAVAVAEHVADGAAKVSPEQLTARLEVCTLCPSRVDDRCSLCGCVMPSKAAMRSSYCPLGKWTPVDEKFKNTGENA
jgi:hypothetical protein